MEVIVTQVGVSASQLDDELRDLSIPEYAGISVADDKVHAVFSADIDVPTQNIVVDAINAHVPNAGREIRLYDYVETPKHDPFTPPMEVDYVTGIKGRIHPTNTIVYQGELRQRQYYATPLLGGDGKVTGYEDLVVQEDFTYTRDPVGFAISRTQTISWARKDGTLHPVTKSRTKHYEPFEAIIEGKRRRGLLADIMAMEMSGWLMATQTQHANPQDRLQMGRDFLRHHKDSFDLFAEVADHQIIYDVRADAEPAHVWLDETWDGTQTVREWMDSQMNIWGLP